jgi:hypothetical protein
MMSRIDSWHWTISTGRHFQNAHHNMAKIQHCPISSQFDMWVGNDVPNWVLTLNPHIKLWWYRTMLIFCDIVAAILKMAIGRNCSMSGINSGHHYLPTYQTKIQHCPISSQFDMWVGNDVPNWVLTLNNFYWSPFSKWPPQYRKKSTLLSTHISNCDDIGQCWIFAVLWWPFWKWRPVEIVQCWESIRDIIIYPHFKLWWYRTMLNFCDIVVGILKMATGRNHHNTAKIQHCPISSQFDMWVDNDVLNWFPTLNNSRNCSMSEINSGHHYLPTY